MSFDTLKLARALEATGLTKEAADAIVAAIKESQEKFVTKDEIDLIEAKFAKSIAETARTQTVWIAGLIFAAIGVVVAVTHFVK